MMSKTTVAQATIAITSPQPTDTVSGTVDIIGSANIEDFSRYEVAYQQGESGWIVFAQEDSQVSNDRLTIWNTLERLDDEQSIFPNGTYTLRLRVFKNDETYQEAYAGNIVVLNEDVDPTIVTPETPETAEEAAAPEETLTPEATGLPTVEVESAVNDDEPVATLTPFAADAPESDTTVPSDTQRDAPSEDPLLVAADSIESLDYSRFGRAFTFGIRIAIGIFAVFLGYLLLRNTLRKLWWFVTTKLFR